MKAYAALALLLTVVAVSAAQVPTGYYQPVAPAPYAVAPPVYAPEPGPASTRRQRLERRAQIHQLQAQALLLEAQALALEEQRAAVQKQIDELKVTHPTATTEPEAVSIGAAVSEHRERKTKATARPSESKLDEILKRLEKLEKRQADAERATSWSNPTGAAPSAGATPAPASPGGR